MSCYSVFTWNLTPQPYCRCKIRREYHIRRDWLSVAILRWGRFNITPRIEIQKTHTDIGQYTKPKSIWWCWFSTPTANRETMAALRIPLRCCFRTTPHDLVVFEEDVRRFDGANIYTGTMQKRHTCSVWKSLGRIIYTDCIDQNQNASRFSTAHKLQQLEEKRE